MPREQHPKHKSRCGLSDCVSGLFVWGCNVVKSHSMDTSVIARPGRCQLNLKNQQHPNFNGATLCRVARGVRCPVLPVEGHDLTLGGAEGVTCLC